MSNIEKLLKYQQEDEKLIRIEQEVASSEERKRYMQAKNFMTKAPEKLDQIDARAAEIERTSEKLAKAYEELAEALKDFDSLDEMVSSEGADVAFYKKSELDLEDKIKSLKGEIASLSAAVKSVDEEYKALKKKVISMQKQYKESHDVYISYRDGKKKDMAAVEEELKGLAKDIPAALLGKYQTKRSERIFPILCEIKGDRCAKCGMELSLAGKEKLAKEGVVECENCHRFLYKK